MVLLLSLIHARAVAVFSDTWLTVEFAVESRNNVITKPRNFKLLVSPCDRTVEFMDGSWQLNKTPFAFPFKSFLSWESNLA